MAFVVTSGQLQSVAEQTNYTFTAPLSRSLALSPHLAMTYEQLWSAQPAVRMVIGFLARNVASIGIDPYRRLSDTDREKAVDHPLARLLERPFFGSQWTKYRLFNTLMHDLGIFDNAFWLKMRTPAGRDALMPISPKLITPLGPSLFAATDYRIRGNRGFIDVPAERVVHFHGYNPDDPRLGISPMETLRHILAEEYAATQYREQMWRNGARISGYIARPKDAGKWGDAARTRFTNEWQAQYAGDGPATGGTPILEDGMTFVASAVTPKDAQYVESRKLTREEVAVAYFLNPMMLGLMEGATVGNTKELHRMLYQDALPPWLTQLSQDIEVQLLDTMDPSSQDGSVYVEFNLREKLRGSFEEQAQALQSAVGGPYLTRNEARAMGNLSSIDGADELIVPLNVINGGLASPNDTAPDQPDNGPSNGQPPAPKAWTDMLSAYFARQGVSVIAKIGAGGTDVERLVSPDRWDTELGCDLFAAGAADVAASINAETRVDLAAALADTEPLAAVTALFDRYANGRAAQLARELEPA
jgi:HK97 family phage portal protein